MSTKVFVDPACDINYASFYLHGLRQIFGFTNVVFTNRYFHGLIHELDCHVMPFVIEEKKYVIDFADSNSLYYDCFLQWADVYGKVNYNEKHLPAQHKDKIVRIGANCGISCYGRNKYFAVIWAAYHWLLCRKRIHFKFGHLLCMYLTVYKRPSLLQYSTLTTMPADRDSHSIFFVTRYWKGQEKANNARVNFIKACKRLEAEGLIKFNGGMVPDTKDNDCPPDICLNHEISMSEYMEGMRTSFLVFNTPAYHECHGWKLPEYLSQGKIILSTPFTNELPQPLEHRKNIYFVELDEEAIYQGIKEIIHNPALQHTLSHGSRQYWEEYANPLLCVKQFLK